MAMQFSLRLSDAVALVGRDIMLVRIVACKSLQTQVGFSFL